MPAIKIIPHSTVKHLFTHKQDVYEVELDSYAELVSYMTNIHPKFVEHMKESNINDAYTTLAILNKEYKKIDEVGELVTKTKDGDIFYVCPTFSGEGSFVRGIHRGIKRIGSGIRNVVRAVKRGIEKIINWFTGDEPTRNDPEEIDNEGNLLGTISMSQDEGNRVALIFGEMRVGGQYISGSKQVVAHSKEDIVRVGDFFNITPSGKNDGNIENG